LQVSGNETRNHANLIWGITELLRGDYKRADYGKVILPLVVMRRLDQVLEERRDAVIEQANERGRQAASTVTTSRRRSRPSKSDGFRV
jgi:type I restriction enzyme M protein